MFKTIDEALTWIMNQHKGELSFSSFKAITNSINNPQNDFYMIHVAGTDGKGSTVAYLRDLLMSQGYKVGTLQSPHYLTHLDRIRVNGENIKKEAFLRILNKNYDFFVENKLGMFEMDYLIMCEYFKEEKIDIAIVEVGLGGRLDSTNVVDNPKLSVITTIGYDHMDRLGNTLELICKEKCCIIKNNSKVLVGELEENLKQIVKDKAKECNSEYYEIQKYEVKETRSFVYRNRDYSLLSYAKYQLHNASLALEALEIISKDYPFTIDYEKAKITLSKTNWQGRFEIVKDNPRVILDGAHNIHGITALCESFDDLKGSKCIIFAALGRKEYQKMIDKLKKHTDKLILTTFAHYEIYDLDNISENDVEINKNYKSAIREAMSKYDNVLICGSLYFLSDVVSEVNFNE